MFGDEMEHDEACCSKGGSMRSGLLHLRRFGSIEVAKLHAALQSSDMEETQVPATPPPSPPPSPASATQGMSPQQPSPPPSSPASSISDAEIVSDVEDAEQSPSSVASDAEDAEHSPSSVASDAEDSPIPASQPPSTLSENAVGGEVDEVDGWISSALIEAVKSGLYHLLNLTVHKFLRDNCYGCLVNHPSQTQHMCLEVLEEGFYQTNYYGLMRRLCTPRLIPSIQRLLTLRNIRVEDERVRCVTETLLHELKSVRKIDESISEMYDDLIGEDVVKIGQLRAVSECWNDK